MAKIEEYIPIVGESVINDLRLLAEKLKGKVIQHINSTAVGGGVAEILNCMVPLLNELGVDTRWDLIKGGEQFFEVTKRFHNLLHGRVEHLTQRDFEIFMETSNKNIEAVNTYGDIVFVHDPQPIALINKKAQNKWIWRCHVDVSSPDKTVWEFLSDFIVKYDAAVFSAPSFSPKLTIRQFLISPSIDPLSDKNKDLPKDVVDSVLRKYNISNDKPIITQISRFDRLKDPLGVIEAFLKVKKYNDCQLILAGGTAADDPEGIKVLEEVKEKAKKDGIAQYTRYGDIIKNAPVVIVVCMDVADSYNRDKDLMAIGACIQNMLLQAHSMGLGACWLGEITNRKKDVAHYLNFHKDYELMSVVSLGYPDEVVIEGSRKNIKNLMVEP
ncbi:MAG: nitroreductase family protein [Candidatus Omnitrophica bacterium]|nr:nitroreductase family protein [Candidatus Omnitrophota bacterium]